MEPALYRSNQGEEVGSVGRNEKGLGHSYQKQQDGEKIYPAEAKIGGKVEDRLMIRDGSFQEAISTLW
jgi:hypothetical protein